MSAKKTAPRTISFAGEQTIRTVAEAHATLLASVAKHNSIALDLSNVDDADLSFVQLIESARMTAASLGKTFCLKTPLPAVLGEQLERAGLLAASTSFWKTP